MKRKVISLLKKVRKKVSKYLSTNRLFVTFIIFSLIETVLVRNYKAVSSDTNPNIRQAICQERHFPHRSQPIGQQCVRKNNRHRRKVFLRRKLSLSEG